MKVLLLSYHPPVPPAGDHVLPTHVRTLAPRVRFVWLSLVEDETQATDFRHTMGPYCHRIETIVSPMAAMSLSPASPTPAVLWRGVRNIAACAARNGMRRTLASAPTAFCYSAPFAARVRELVTQERPDVVHFQDQVTSTHRVDVPAGTPTVFMPVDAISRWYHEGYRTSTHTLASAAQYARCRESQAWERTVLPSFHRTVVVSRRDARWLETIAPRAAVETIPLCVDTAHFRPLDVPDDPPSLLFTGIFTYAANRHALRYLVNDILPGLRSVMPALRLHVVGRDPDAWIRRLSADPRNAVDTAVDDVRIPMAAATISVAPMLGGTGTKLKVLRAMAMGRPVVTTTEGSEGVEGARDGVHLHIADSPSAFVECTLRLLRSRDVRRAMGARARALMLEHHSPERWAARFHTLYQESVSA